MVKFGIWFFYTTPFIIIILVISYLTTKRPELIFEPSTDQLIILGFLFGSLFFIKISLNKLYHKEMILVRNKDITLIDKFFFNSKRRTFDKKKIQNLKYVGRQDFTDHPLDTQGFDHLGFGASEKEIHFFIDEGNIAFLYDGKMVRFGRNVWDEEGAEIINKILK